MCHLKNNRIISVHFQGKLFNITVIQIQIQASITNAEKAEVEQFYENVQHLLELTPKKDVLFIIGDWNAKVGSQEIPEVTGKHPLPTTQEMTTHVHHQMVNTKIRLIVFFASEDEEALYSQQKQDRELTVVKS